METIWEIVNFTINFPLESQTNDAVALLYNATTIWNIIYSKHALQQMHAYNIHFQI